MKIWTDKYAFSVEVKNSGDMIRPRVVVVTSNYKIEQIFPDPSIHEPLLARFKVIHKEHPWDANVNTVLVRQPQDPYAERIMAKRKEAAEKTTDSCTTQPSFGSNSEELEQFSPTEEGNWVKINKNITVICDVEGCKCDQHQ